MDKSVQKHAKACKSMQKHAKACKSMQKHHQTSIFVTTHLIPFWANYIGNPKPRIKVCKSMQKHAKAPINFVFREYPLKETFGKLYGDFKTVDKSVQKYAKACKSTISLCFS